MEATYKTDEAAYKTLDELVTARKEKWTKMQTERTERDNKKKNMLASKKKALADNVEAAKGEFEATRKAMTAKRKAYQEALGKLGPAGTSATASTMDPKAHDAAMKLKQEMEELEGKFKDKRQFFDNLNEEKSKFQAQEEQKELEREGKRAEEEAKRTREDKKREKAQLTKDQKKDKDAMDALDTATNTAEDDWKKTITDQLKEGNAKLKAKFDQMDKRRKALKASVQALTDKLGKIGTALSDLDASDKKRKEDKAAADTKRQKDLKAGFDAAIVKLKAKRQAVHKLRERMANMKSVTQKATL